MNEQVKQRFAGIERLYGVGALERLQGSRVAVVGMGGVGSWVVEAQAQGLQPRHAVGQAAAVLLLGLLIGLVATVMVGHLTLIDADDICVSNTNRQLPAMEGNYGRNKAEAMAERCRAINPEIEVDAVQAFLTVSNMAELLGRGFDLVIDACDSFRVKVETIAWCRRRKLPLLTVGAAGGRTDPTLVRIRDVSRTEHDAMLALIRKKLRSEFNFPKNAKRYFGVPAVYSLENVKYPQADGSVCGLRPNLGADAALKLDCGAGLGAATHITGAFAFAAVGKALEMLLEPKKVKAEAAEASEA
jgi:tRNA threonylcarbamoyladenosine dehydratase